jgi:hypothetical protein
MHIVCILLQNTDGLQTTCEGKMKLAIVNNTTTLTDSKLKTEHQKAQSKMEKKTIQDNL